MKTIGHSYEEDNFRDRIYEASVLPEFWPGVLREFAEFAESRDACVIARSGQDFQSASSSEAMETVVRDVYEYPGGHERTRRLLAAELPGFITDLDVYAESEMHAEPLFAEYLFPRGLGRGIATVIRVPSGETILFHAEGDASRGPVRPDLRTRLNQLRPHLARASLLSARLAFERARSAVETLSAIGLAACSVSRLGTVLIANTQFDAESALWTTRGGNRIALLDRRADQLLQEALAMIRTDVGVRSLAVLAADGHRPAVLHVVPVRRSAHDLFSQASAILVLTGRSDAPARSAPLLQALFDLSPAEAAVASSIAAGRTATEIARADGKTVGTVRIQLKSVLAKTGCRRQVDLARLVARLLPG